MVHFCYGTLKPNSGNIVITQIDLEERENLEQYYRSGGQLDYCDPLKLAIDLKIQLVNDSDDLNIYNLSVA
jgi:hypothetical protein